MDAKIVSKGEFARLIAVSPGRVSQMIADGMISGAALVGDGRMARIDVGIATAQIRSRRDIGQALGNGLGTRLDVAPPPSSFESAAPTAEPRMPLQPAEPATEDLIKLERLAHERRRNRQAEEDDAKRRGEIMDSAQARIEMAKIANSMLQTFEGALPEMATALAAKFEISQRDVLHELKQRFIDMRKAAAERDQARAAELPQHREMVIAAGESHD